MKILNIHNREKNFPVIVQEQKKTIHVSTVHPHKGHTCYELDKTTGEIKPALIKEVQAAFTGGTAKKVLIRENCLYTTALNIENAQKKFFKYLRTGCAQTAH